MHLCCSIETVDRKWPIVNKNTSQESVDASIVAMELQKLVSALWLHGSLFKLRKDHFLSVTLADRWAYEIGGGSCFTKLSILFCDATIYQYTINGGPRNLSRDATAFFRPAHVTGRLRGGPQAFAENIQAVRELGPGTWERLNHARRAFHD